MFEILAVLLALVLAAKKGRGRRRGRLIKGVIKLQEALTTLAPNTGLLDPTDTVDDAAFIISVHATYALVGNTAGEGPIKLYWAHSDYSLAEVEEFIELTTGWSEMDEVSKEISKRKIRAIGQISGGVSGESLANGEVVKTRIGFMVQEGQGLNLVSYMDGTAPLTTGASVFVTGHAWIRPT